MGYVGRQKNDPQLKGQATQLYIEALQMLRQMQGRSARNWFNNAESLLGAILMFSKYELLSSADGGGYSIHIEGGLKILRESMQHMGQTQLSKIVIRKFRCSGVSKVDSNEMIWIS
jgi:hypothetical protein